MVEVPPAPSGIKSELLVLAVTMSDRYYLSLTITTSNEVIFHKGLTFTENPS